MSKILIDSTYESSGNTSISDPKRTIVKAGEEHRGVGFLVESNHQYVQVWSFNLDSKNPTLATVALRPNFFQSILNLIQGQKWTQVVNQKVLSDTTFPISRVDYVSFDNGDVYAHHTFIS